MKTIQKGEEIVRVSNEEADNKIHMGWKLVAKKLWKENVRGPVKAPAKVVEKEPKKEKTKKD